MTEEDIKNAISKTNGLQGMTVNERLYVTGLMDEFDFCKVKNKGKAEFILRCLGIDEPLIRKILDKK